jgi:hypothetical protein
MKKTRRQKRKLIGRFIISHIGKADILSGIPGIIFACMSLGFAVAMFNDQALAEKFAAFGKWPLYEIVSVLIFQYMLFIFDPDPAEAIATPVWQRVAALFAIPLFLFGLRASFLIFKKIFIYFWPFIITKAVALYLRRPAEKDRTVGCLGAAIGLFLLIPLCLLAITLEAGPAWYLLAGFPYFTLLGFYEIVSGPVYLLPDYEYWDLNEE